MIKILIADDQTLFCDSLKFLIEQEEDMQVVGCAADGREAYEFCAKLCPDIVLMDIVMPGCDGVEGTRLIKTEYDSIKVIILTTFSDQQNVTAALANGADGYILKEISSEDLILAIKNVAQGFGIIHKKTYNAIVNQFHSGGLLESNPINMDAVLSERELQVIRYIASGKDSQEIAELLYIGVGRVKNIVTGILKKLQVKDRAQLVIYAIKKNLI
ncbi:MAG TPA: response regulator transcription factor [Bacillota bacterium]|nr:response regulator transcription factor [Bacillota bacterium]